MNLEIQISGAPAARSLLALPGEPDELAIGHSGRDRHPHRMSLQIQRAIRADFGPLQLERAGRPGYASSRSMSMRA